MNGKRIVSKQDHQRILSKIESPEKPEASHQPTLQLLKKELSKAKKIDPKEVPQDLITMNSKFVLKDIGDAKAYQFTLVYPEDFEPKEGKISVLSPHGTALIGIRVGEVVRWPFAGGEKYLRVQELLYQPAASDHFHL
ncbi:transcription elongation factor GreAB [Leptospira perolatii]|uniref:Transcription elongation factor GreAB n=1 Tax=Leptospira perolatii TaxID=2023191 RepID=A0A2M9ZSE7_9LEPT|nr:GreA/GreB family elongation factor [Leptospira perolatii]PJZ71482.1 transcription elongation factor GreAB [Leptospira perolatii]PJZ75017.1 transcription elongation factor GreAB [Leptospira perolatii]